MPANSLGSRPIALRLLAVLLVVVDDEEGIDDLGDFRSSLLELALLGGLGDGEALAPLGDGADLESLLGWPGELLPFPVRASIPGMFIPGIPIPYMAASWLLGSMAAMAAIMLELGFFGSRPSAARVIGSILRFLGSSPIEARTAGSIFFGSMLRA